VGGRSGVSEDLGNKSRVDQEHMTEREKAVGATDHIIGKRDRQGEVPRKFWKPKVEHMYQRGLGYPL